jgi:hypothetical protein
VASVTATANATVGSYSVTANVTGASTPASFSLTNNMSAGPPTVVSLSPNSGSGTEQTFKGVYSDPNGAADLGTLGLLLNTAVNGVDARYVLYYPATNLIYLKNNADTGLSAGITPGSTGSASNSQCTLTGTGSSYSASGTTATLTVALTFTGTFITPTNVYLYASETNTTASNSGWVKMGTWGVSAGLPTVVSLSPSSGSGAAQTFKGVYSDPNGATDLSTVRLLFNTAVNGVDACYVLYYPATNFLYLENNADTGLSAGVTPGSTGSASNSQCTLAGTGSSYSASGTTATLTVALTFTGTFVTPDLCTPERAT